MLVPLVVLTDFYKLCTLITGSILSQNMVT